MSERNENEQTPAIVVEDAEGGPDRSAAPNVDHSKKSLAPSVKGGKNTKSKTSKVSKTDAGKMQMPSQQARQLTTAYNQLLALKDAGSAEGIVHQTIKNVEVELFKLKEQLEEVKPETDLQKKFKDSWIAQNVQRKEEYLIELKKALIQDAIDREECDSSSSTSSNAELQAAVEEEALLRLQEEQLLRRQELRRRQREEEQREQQERDELQRKLHAARSRTNALSKASSRNSRVAPSEEPLRDTRSRRPEPMLGPRGAPPQLPRITQPTQEWLNDVGQHTHTGTVEPQGTMDFMQQMLLSQAKVPIFKGEHLEYLWFKQSFEMQVERVTNDPVQRLYRLLQCLEGEPLKLVRGCQLSTDPEEGYLRAQKLLTERYGHPVRQALAFKGKLLSWPEIKSTTDLTNFCIHLQQCMQVKLSNGGLGELDSASTLLAIASKLPEKMQSSWQTRVVDIETRECRGVDYKDFVEFVQRQENAKNHPVFGKLGRAEKRENVTTKAKVFATATAHEESTGTEATSLQTSVKSRKSTGEMPQITTADAFKPPCLFCDKEHPTSKCKSKELTRDQKKERLRGLCFACLKPGHAARHCKFRLKCDQCDGLHPTVMHDDSLQRGNASDKGNEKSKESETGVKMVKENSMVTLGSASYSMATVQVRVWAPGAPDHSRQRDFVEVTALLDPASSASFLSEEAVLSLGAPVRPLDLQLSTMAGETHTRTKAVQNLRIADSEGNNTVTVGLTYVVKELPKVTSGIPEQEARQLPHLFDVPRSALQPQGPIHMLIGQNVHGVHTPEDVRRGADDEPFAVKSKLGWTLQGPVKAHGPTNSEVVNFTNAQAIKEQLDKLYYQEFQGAHDFGRLGPSQEDAQWSALVEATAHRLNMGNFCIELPFKEGMANKLANNRVQAEQRLQCLKRRFERDETFQADYCAFVQKMIDADHVELVPKDAENLEGKDGINYIPHHGVYHPQKKKIRVVFNCASKYQGLAVNDCLLSGPDLTNSLVGVLIRFRQFRVAFTADVEAMFYQVSVPPHQRDYLRFLWWEGGGTTSVNMNKIATYRMKVHLFGATSSPSIANYALRRSAREAHEESHISEEAKTTVLRNFYVDDCLKSMDTGTQAAEMAKELITACSHGGFKLAKFVSTSIDVLRALSKEQLAKELEEVNLNDDKNDPLGSLQERALGVAWDVQSDRLGFKVKQGQCADTKRAVLSKLSQVYDPLGMAAPVLIVARMLFRDLTTQADKGWDDKLEKEDLRKWQSWSNGLSALRDTSITRWMSLHAKPEKREEYQLHAFCDASAKAYSAVAYIRVISYSGVVSVSFLFGKARVSPPKVVTIPRLELTAAKLAAEVMDMVETEIEVPIHSRTLWSDSQTVLKYLNNKSKRFHVFVANKVEFILNKTKAQEWRYVPTNQNPADEATRGLEAQSLNQSAWLRGPEFLRLKQEDWPDNIQPQELKDDDPEVRTEKKGYSEAALLTVNKEEESIVEIMAQRYSCALKLRKAAAIWLRVKHKLMGKHMESGMFHWQELKQAEAGLIKWSQAEAWGSEIQELQKGQRPPTWLRPLTPTVQEGTLVTNTRTREQLPIIPSGTFAKLLVQEAHASTAHLGKQTTMARVRRRYWIVQLGSLTRKVLQECTWCQRRKAQPACTQMAPLPEIRMQPGPPFQTTGIDFFGPFYVKTVKPDKDARATEKAYGVIFTCAVSRAVHLEAVESLDVSSFINALRRFCARRGAVKRIISDNGTNLEGAHNALDKELKAAIKAHGNDPAVVSQMRAREIEWHFLPPMASHFGGFYERLIRSARQVLDALLSVRGRRSALSRELLTTLLCECESVLNDRPLTTVSDDPNDFEALTPNHLLLGRSASGSSAPCGDYNQVVTALRHRWKRVQQLVLQFWQRWKSEYRTLLYKRSKWYEKTNRPIKSGDIVLLLGTPLMPREYWKLGRITKVHPSADGETRVVEVKTAQGTYTRPITKLCLLEAANEN